ncbi:hypothetical protein QLX67_12105 [Balneolaceae bacterium ANBcel3]|nr:hypothetical protein [Balneolaceae bacterium ANBcel3]
MLKAETNGNVLTLKSYNHIITGVISVVLMIAGPVLFVNTITATDKEWFLIALGVALFIGGVALLLYGVEKKTYIFDKNQNMFIQEAKKLTGSHEERIALDQIKQIYVSKSLQRTRRSEKRGGGTQTEFVFQYLLEFSNGASILLDQKRRRARSLAFSSGSTPRPIRVLSEFLDIPVKETTLSDVKDKVMDVISGLGGSSR